MGLDMYLSAKVYMSKYNDKLKKQREKIRKLFPEVHKTDNLDYVEVNFEVGYWRKANQIHKWFVDNVQDGKDECRTEEVSREQLEQLLKICKEIVKKCKLKKGKVISSYSIGKNGKRTPNYEEGKVILNPELAKELLPVQSGFFFGGEEYDEYYFNDIEQTIQIIESCLKLPKEYDFEYHSSW